MPREFEQGSSAGDKNIEGIGSSDAPISITVRGYKEGFSVLLTKKSEGDKLLPLLDGVDYLIEELKKRGYKPSWADETNVKALGEPRQEDNSKPKEEKKDEELPVCQIHNKPMKKRSGANGAVFYSHAFQNKETGDWVYCSGKGYGKK